MGRLILLRKKISKTMSIEGIAYRARTMYATNHPSPKTSLTVGLLATVTERGIQTAYMVYSDLPVTSWTRMSARPLGRARRGNCWVQV
jgi:hypothetical protein